VLLEITVQKAVLITLGAEGVVCVEKRKEDSPVHVRPPLYIGTERPVVDTTRAKNAFSVLIRTVRLLSSVRGDVMVFVCVSGLWEYCTCTCMYVCMYMYIYICVCVLCNISLKYPFRWFIIRVCAQSLIHSPFCVPKDGAFALKIAENSCALADALAYTCCVAALSTTRVGAQDSLPMAGEVNGFLRHDRAEGRNDREGKERENKK
jgi:hypothetical protein